MKLPSWIAAISAAGLFATLLAAAPSHAQTRRGIPINIESTPAGATVHLDAADGESLGTTPLRNIRVPRGDHDLFFVLEGYEPHTEHITVLRRRATTEVTLLRQSRLVVSAAAPTAAGAQVSVDGQPVGTVPHEMVVPPGRHLLQVEQEGFITFTQWVEVAQGDGMTVPVLLEREPPRAGSILVAGGIPGSEIRLDGELRGSTPMVVEGVPEGVHSIEIRAEGLTPYTQEVTVRAGQRTTVTPDLRATAVGTLVVVASAQGAIIRVDGEVVGASPATVEELAAGEHLVEASAPAYEATTRTVTVEVGQRRVLTLELAEEPRAPGRLVVSGGTPGATVTVDGEARGTVPLVLRDLTAGPHAVVVEAEGFESLRTTCEIEPEQDCVIEARLRGRPTAVIVRALGVIGAELLVDGESVGPIPFEGAIAGGSHRIEVRAPGYASHVEQVMLEYSAEARRFDVDLERLRTGPSDEEIAAEHERQELAATAAVSHGAAPLPEGLAAIDVSVGWPHSAEARVGVGLLEGIDAGFGIRTFGRLTQFEARSTIGFRPIELLGIGGRLRSGGGVGPDNVNSFFLTVEALATLYFGGHGGLTVWIGVDGHTDRYDWTEADSSVPIANPGDRQDMIRARLGGSIEWSIDRHWGIFGNLEGILASTGDGRRVYGDIFGFGNTDTQLYFRLGGTYKF